MFSSEEKEIENEIDISLVKTKTSFHPPRDSCLDKTIVFFYYSKLFKLLARINQILSKLSGKIY